ncbi:MAG: sulfatase-like hydrolase/transferase [Candidatus Eisenbacteria bacterium]|nr:sulfatase-like hydrolase/transferase [Candidatus Eisenbacteria bacterium]
MTAPQRSFWRAWGAGFLAAGVLAILAGLIETWAAEFRAPGFADLLYGAAVHLLFVLVLTLALRVVFLRASDAAFLWIALGGALAFELCIVVPYWITAESRALVFASATGKLLTALLLLIGALVAVGIARAGYVWTRRRAGRAGGARPASGAAAFAGGLLALTALVLSVGFVLRELPRDERVPLRADAAERERPDVFVILIDTLRRDHLSFFGYERPTSPRLDRFLGESYAFGNAYTPSTWTIPSVASLFSGVYPTSHGIYGESWTLPPGIETLARYFRSYGYRTAAFVGNKAVSPLNGYDQGFGLFVGHSFWWGWNDRTFLERLAKRLGRSRRPGVKGFGPVINARFLDWLDGHADAPRFAYLHYMDPHHPYRPPRAYRDAVAPGVGPGPHRTPSYADHTPPGDCADWECLDDPPTMSAAELAGMIANYDGEIRHLDRLLGELFDALAARGLDRSAHLLLFTDHGEEFFDHRGWRHGRSIYEEVVGCVMAYRPPGGVPGGRIIQRPVAMLDLPRTLFDLIETEVPAQHQGRVIPELLPRKPATEGRLSVGGELAVLSERPPTLYALRKGRWKLIRRGSESDPDWRLFDMEVDPREQNDLAAAHPDTVARLRGELEALVGVFAQTQLGEGPAEVDPRSLERLRALGYIK